MSYPAPPSPSPPPSPPAYSGGASGHGRGLPSPPPPPPSPPPPLVDQPVHVLDDYHPLLQHGQSAEISNRFEPMDDSTEVHDAADDGIDQQDTTNTPNEAPDQSTMRSFWYSESVGDWIEEVQDAGSEFTQPGNTGMPPAWPMVPSPLPVYSSGHSTPTVETAHAITEIEQVISPNTQSGSDYGGMELEVVMQGSETQLEQQQTEAETSNAITWSIFLAFEAIALFIGVLIGYETIVYGGSTDSDMFIDKFFSKEHYKQIGFETVFVCDYYSWKIQAVNCTFHFVALISILVVEIALAVKGKCSYLILLGVGCILHALGGLICALAQDYIIFWMGRGLKGVGVGILFESIPIMMNMIGPECKKVVENWHKFGLLFGPVVATFLNMMMGLKDNSTPWKPASVSPGALSAATFLLVVYLIKKPEVAKEWQYRGITCRRRSRPLVFMEVVRIFATPIQDLNLYSHIIVMLFTPSPELTSSAPFAISACQFIGLVTNGWYVKLTRTKLICSSLIMAVIQVVTFLTISIRNNVTSPFSASMGVTLIVGQTFFMLGHSVVSSPAGWVKFPLEDEVKAVERWMPIISMAVQGGIALLSPLIMCELEVKVYAIWAVIAAVLSCFIYLLVPESGDATSKEMQRERFRSHWFWKYWL